jgi:hypothetical protein
MVFIIILQKFRYLRIKQTSKGENYEKEKILVRNVGDGVGVRNGGSWL